MNKAKALIKYNKQMLANYDIMDDMLKTIVDNMESLILKDIANALKNTDTPLSVTEKLYRAEFWKDNQEKLYGKKDVLLDKFFKIYKTDIDSLKKIYPGSDFNISSIDYQLQQYDTFMKSELDILKLMKVSESDAIGLVRMAQFGNITDNQALIDLIQGKLKAPLSHIDTRLKTTQSVIYRNNRQNFYRKIKEGGKRYIYAGPNDGVTRPFCRENIGKIRTETEWRALSNTGKGGVGDAWNYGGGYNCRHAVYLVTNNWTDEEVKEMQDSLKVVK